MTTDPLAPPDRPERTAPLTADDIDTIVEGIREFICYGDPEVDGLWEPYCLKLLALKATLGDVAVPARAHQEEKEKEMHDELARSETTEIRDRQPAAVTDAGSQNDRAEPTPGPWRQNALLVEDAHGVLVAHCTRWEGRTPMPEVAEANARLCAAAPELLAALKGMIDLYEPVPHAGEPWTATLAHDAIRKAEGR